MGSIKYHTHLQVAELVAKPPPMMGPRTVPAPQDHPVKAKYMGLSFKEVMEVIRAITPK